MQDAKKKEPEDTIGSGRLHYSQSSRQLQQEGSEEHNAPKRDHQQRLKLKAGDILEFWREPEDKETSGWRGPGKLVFIDHETGNLHVEWQGKVLICRVQDVRATLLSWCVYIATIHVDVNNDLAKLMEFAEQMVRKESIEPVSYTHLTLPTKA